MKVQKNLLFNISDLIDVLRKEKFDDLSFEDISIKETFGDVPVDVINSLKQYLEVVALVSVKEVEGKEIRLRNLEKHLISKNEHLRNNGINYLDEGQIDLLNLIPSIFTDTVMALCQNLGLSFGKFAETIMYSTALTVLRTVEKVSKKSSQSESVPMIFNHVGEA